MSSDLGFGLAEYKHLGEECSRILSTVNDKLENLRDVTAPFQQASMLYRAEENVSKTKISTEELLAYLDTPQKVAGR